MTLRQIAHKIYPDSMRKRVRFVLKASISGKHYIYEMQSIFEDSKLQAIIDANPRQYEKIFRPYLYASLKLQDRMEFVKNHYEFTKQHWSEELIKAVYVDRSFQLARVDISPDGENHVTIYLSRETSFANEGEIFVALNDMNGNMLFALNFNFIRESDTNGILISCMKGAAGEGSRDAIREITKDMHGLRPHHLLLFVLQSMAGFYGFGVIKAISTQAHVYNATGRGERIKTDYDGFWEEAVARWLMMDFIFCRFVKSERVCKRSRVTRERCIEDDSR